MPQAQIVSVLPGSVHPDWAGQSAIAAPLVAPRWTLAETLTRVLGIVGGPSRVVVDCLDRDVHVFPAGAEPVEGDALAIIEPVSVGSSQWYLATEGADSLVNARVDAVTAARRPTFHPTALMQVVDGFSRYLVFDRLQARVWLYGGEAAVDLTDRKYSLAMRTHYQFFEGIQP